MFGDLERDTDWRILGRGDIEGDLTGIDAGDCVCLFSTLKKFSELERRNRNVLLFKHCSNLDGSSVVVASEEECFVAAKHRDKARA